LFTYSQRYFTNFQVPLSICIRLRPSQTLNRLTITTYVKLLPPLKANCGLNYNLRWSNRSLPSQKYAECSPLLKRSLQLINDTIIWNILFSINKKWQFINNCKDAKIIKNLRNMLSPQIYLRRYRISYHHRKTEVIII